MLESPQNKLPYSQKKEEILGRKAMLALDYEQILEIANIVYYVNKTLAKVPKWLGGVRLSAESRALHKTIHDACINCCISLEAQYDCEQRGDLK